jgi:hypothetical protein
VADKRLLRFSGTLQINSRAKGFAKKAPGATETAMRSVLRKAKEDAQKNVAKGEGPGPHPHLTDHEDTGDLARSVQDAIWLQGFLTEGTIFTDSEYGTYLEVGWRTKKNNFYRYPWLKPAFLGALSRLPKLAAETFRTQMQDFDEDRIVKGDDLDSWADAAKRWAADIAKANAPTESPEIPPKWEPRFSATAKRRHREGLRLKGGRPKDTSELGPELKRAHSANDERIARQKRDKAFDSKKAPKVQRDSEQERRSKISVSRVVSDYEREQARIQASRDKERNRARAESEAQRREAQARLNAQKEVLAKSRDRVAPIIKAPKPPRTPSVKRPRKKK